MDAPTDVDLFIATSVQAQAPRKIPQSYPRKKGSWQALSLLRTQLFLGKKGARPLMIIRIGSVLIACPCGHAFLFQEPTEIPLIRIFSICRKPSYVVPSPILIVRRITPVCIGL